MFSLRDLHFMLCSLDLNVLHAQSIMGFLNLSYPQINKVGRLGIMKHSLDVVHVRMQVKGMLQVRVGALLLQSIYVLLPLGHLVPVGQLYVTIQHL